MVCWSSVTKAHRLGPVHHLSSFHAENGWKWSGKSNTSLCCPLCVSDGEQISMVFLSWLSNLSRFWFVSTSLHRWVCPKCGTLMISMILRMQEILHQLVAIGNYETPWTMGLYTIYQLVPDLPFSLRCHGRASGGQPQRHYPCPQCLGHVRPCAGHQSELGQWMGLLEGCWRFGFGSEMEGEPGWTMIHRGGSWISLDHWLISWEL